MLLLKNHKNKNININMLSNQSLFSIDNNVLEEGENEGEFLEEDSESKVTKDIYDSLFPRAFSPIKEGNQYHIHFISGNSYVGTIWKNKLHGEGVYTWADGVIYSGCFLENYLQNYGTIGYPGDIKYSGDIYNNHWSSFGTLNFGGIELKGHFQNGKAYGYSSIVNSTFKSFHGKMLSNKPKSGIRKYLNGTFKGIFDVFGCRFKGKFVFDNKDSYDGFWHNDAFCDFGIYKWRDRLVDNPSIFLENYVGYWIGGMRHGIGKIEFQDRLVCCNWEKNLKSGPGLIIAANGAVFASLEMFTQNNFLGGVRIKRTKDSCDLINDLISLSGPEYPKYEKEIVACTSESECSCILSFESYEFQEISDLTDIESEDYSYEHLKQTFDCSQNKMLSRLEIFKIKIQFLIQEFSISDEILQNGLFISNYEIDREIIKPWIFQTIREYCPTCSIESVYEKELIFLNQVFLDNYSLCRDLYDMYTTLSRVIIKRCHSNMIRLGLWLFFENVFIGSKINTCELIIKVDSIFGLTGRNKNIWNPFNRVYFWEFLLHILYAASIFYMNPFIYKYIEKHLPVFYGRLSAMVLIFLRENQFIEPLLENTTLRIFQHNFSHAKELFSNLSTNYPATLRNYVEYIAANFGKLDYNEILDVIIKEKFTCLRDFNIILHKTDYQITPIQFFDLVIQFIKYILINK